MELMRANILGEGTPLLVLHGFLGMSDNWKTIGRKYAEAGYEVHLLDQRNHGRSFWSDQFDYPTLAEDVKRYMDAGGISEAILHGHSMGGKTAMQMACTQQAAAVAGLDHDLHILHAFAVGLDLLADVGQ